jgi:hypothetical protein
MLQRDRSVAQPGRGLPYRSETETQTNRFHVIIIISSLFTDFPGTFPLEPVANPTTQASIF